MMVEELKEAFQDNSAQTTSSISSTVGNTLLWQWSKPTCPNCGYCPHCGRGHQYPVYPVYPNYPVYPWGPYTYTVTCSGV